MNKEEFPLVSVCIPVFNGEEFIAEALESVKSQTYPNLELIISDDQSMDGSKKIIEEFLTTTSFSNRLVTNTDQGIGRNWNNCLRYTSGKYVKFLFQDDVLFPDCVKEMVVIAEADENLGMVFSDRKILLDESNPSHLNWFKSNGELNRYWQRPLETGIYPSKRILKDSNLFLVKPWNKIGEPSSQLFRKSVFEKVGFFDTELVQFLDFEFSLRVLSQFKFGYIQKKLTGFRLHEFQASSDFSKKKINERSVLIRKLNSKLFFKVGLPSKKIIVANYLPDWVLNVIKKRR